MLVVDYEHAIRGRDESLAQSTTPTFQNLRNTLSMASLLAAAFAVVPATGLVALCSAVHTVHEIVCEVLDSVHTHQLQRLAREGCPPFFAAYSLQLPAHRTPDP